MSHIDLHPDELFDALRAGRLGANDARRLRAHCAQCEACTMELAWAEAGLHKVMPNGDDHARGARAVAALLGVDDERADEGADDAANAHADDETALGQPATATAARIERPAPSGPKRSGRRRQLALAMLIVAVSGSSAAALWTGQPLLARLRILVGQIVLDRAATGASTEPDATRRVSTAAKTMRPAEQGLETQHAQQDEAVLPQPAEAPMTQMLASEAAAGTPAAELNTAPANNLAPARERATPPSGAAAAAPAHRSTQAGPTAGRMLRRAAELRAAGDFAAAAKAYGVLQQRFPRMRSAQAARIAQGNLYLHQLRSPERSVAAFSAYLVHDPHGALAEEALSGMATAYARLHRPAHEAQTWQRLLSAHPHSLYAPAARRRLGQLAGQRLDEGGLR